MSDDSKDFLCEYPFQGGRWAFTIKATSHDEAIARLKQMPWAEVLGEIGYRIPADVPAAGLFARAADVLLEIANR